MRTSPETTKILPALIQARAAFPPIVKDAVARVAGRSDYHYADLSAILEAVQPPLLKHELALVQTVDAESSSLLTRLAHVSGEWIESVYPLAMDLAPQALGSALTYARRYSISALLCLAASDDDGAEATAVKAPKAKAPKAPPSVPPLISDAQRKRLFAIAKGSGWNDAQMKDYLRKRLGLESTREIRDNVYDQLCDVFSMPFEPEGEHA